MDLSSRLPPVVVGVDGTGPSVAAAAAAAEEAARRSLPLRLVRALPGPETIAETPRVHRVPLSPHRAAVAELAPLRRTLLHHLPGGRIAAAAVTGPPVWVLLDEAASAALLVLGTCDTEPREPHAGAVTGAVAQRSPCPVLVVRPGPHPPADAPVLVAVDGGPGTGELLSTAAREATLRGTGLDVVPVLRPGSPPPGLSAELADLTGADPELPVRLAPPVRADVPTVAAAARGAALLVVGRGDADPHLRALLAAAPTAVLVVPLSRAAVPEPGAVRALRLHETSR